MYSKTLFNKDQPNAQMQLWAIQEDVLGTAGQDGIALMMKNTGSGSTIGPVLATLSTTDPCASPNTFGAVSATAAFGRAGQVIAPGDTLYGHAVNSAGVTQNTNYAYLVNFNMASCAGNDITFTVSITDSRGSTWADGFVATAQ
jgi:hypothetical protein